MNEPLVGQSPNGAQPAGPALQFQATPDAAIFAFQLGNGLSIQQVVSADVMQQIWKIWLESRKELMKQNQLVADVLRNKN